MICPKCKSEIKDDSKFCGKCGQKIPRCPTCGRPILERARFCIYDGTMIPDDMLNLLPEETAEGIEENQDQQERREQAVVKKTGRQKKKKVFVVLGVILGIVVCAGVGYAAVHALSGKKNVDQKQEQKIAREEKKETTAVPEKISESSKSKQKTDQDEIASVSENTTENQETDTKVKTKSETEYAETEENKKTVSESKEETSTVSESKAPEIIHTYEVIAGDLSWEDAKNACEERGGYLATITSEEEYEKIGEMADRSGLTYLWLGAKLQSDTEEWKQAGWITGEDWTFDNWYPGEPSRQDADGTKELFLCMWKAKYNEEEIGWTFNDQRNDIVGAFPKIAGKVGYVCEYERETNG